MRPEKYPYRKKTETLTDRRLKPLEASLYNLYKALENAQKPDYYEVDEDGYLVTKGD